MSRQVGWSFEEGLCLSSVVQNGRYSLSESSIPYSVVDFKLFKVLQQSTGSRLNITQVRLAVRRLSCASGRSCGSQLATQVA